MFVTPAYAQTPAPGGGDFLIQLLPFLLIFVIFYMLIIRPNQQRLKVHREMIANVKRGDTIVTSGGIIGKITKVVDDGEVEIEVARDTRIRLVRGTIAEVRAKGEPAKEGS